MTDAALIANVHFERPLRSSPKFVLDVALEFAPGTTIILGPSGSGKSTLLDCIAGLLKPQRGKIKIGNESLFDTEAGADVRPERRQIGYVFQTLALFPHLTVQNNVTYGLANLPAAEQNHRAAEILSAFRIESLHSRKPNELSGGEQQRVALARSLVTNPCVLLLDEPMTGLDAELKTSITQDLLTWNALHKIPIVYVTHSKEEAATVGGRFIFLKDGGVVQQEHECAQNMKPAPPVP